MEPKEFAYWLQGFFEITEAASTPTLTPDQVKMIRQHLDLVFTKVKRPAPNGHSGVSGVSGYTDTGLSGLSGISGYSC